MAAFVPALPVPTRGSSGAALLTHAAPGAAATAAAAAAAARAASRVAPAAFAPRMGYGDYSYSTDRTQGHLQQYYIDKFRVAADFARGRGPTDDADAIVGRNAKGAVLIPRGGVPQPVDPILLPDPAFDPPATEDPRVAEAEGAMYPWDRAYKDPRLEQGTPTDLDDPEIFDSAFVDFVSATKEDRRQALNAFRDAFFYRLEESKKPIAAESSQN
jgi:hypothetical protein